MKKKKNPPLTSKLHRRTTPLPPPRWESSDLFISAPSLGRRKRGRNSFYHLPPPSPPPPSLSFPFFFFSFSFFRRLPENPSPLKHLTGREETRRKKKKKRERKKGKSLREEKKYEQREGGSRLFLEERKERKEGGGGGGVCGMEICVRSKSPLSVCLSLSLSPLLSFFFF